MRISTWNINGIRARLDYLRLWLEERQPDLVGLQELKSTEEQFPYDELRELGYHATTHCQKAWNGVAVLSREPVTLRQAGLANQDEQGARLIAVDAGDLCFATVYCPNGKSVGHPDFPRKLEWFDDLRRFVETNFEPNQNVVLCGDFNIVPAAVDSWAEDVLEGGIFHTVAERERFAAFQEWGFHDVWRTRNPTKPGFTWWDYRAGAFHKDRGLRIDIALATRPVLDRVVYMQVERDWRKKVDGLTPSDHCPVTIDLLPSGETDDFRFPPPHRS